MADIVTLAVLSAFLCALTFAPRQSGLYRAVALLAGFALLLAILQPAVNAVQELRALPEQLETLLSPVWEEAETIEDRAENWVISRGVQNIESGVKKLLCVRYALEEEQILVDAAISRDSENTVMIDSLVVQIFAEEIHGADEIETYLAQLLLCPCQVIIGGAR